MFDIRKCFMSENQNYSVEKKRNGMTENLKKQVSKNPQK